MTVIILFTNDFMKETNSAIAVWQPWFTAFGVVGTGLFAAWTQDKIDKREREQRLRKNFAARAVLPAALARIGSYAEQCITRIEDQRSGLPKNKFEVPAFPTDESKEIKECIEFSEGKPQERLAELLYRLQIQHSRISAADHRYQGLRQTDFNQFLIDALEIYARTETLFPYARGETTEDPGAPTRDQMHRAANILWISKEDRVRAKIDLIYK